MKFVTDIKTVNTNGIEAETYLPAAEKTVQGKPEQTIWNCFSSPDEKFSVGTWDSQAGEWKVSYSEDEFCLILEGESVIKDSQGRERTVKSGDQFVIPAGFQGTWCVPHYCKKVYVIYEANA